MCSWRHVSVITTLLVFAVLSNGQVQAQQQTGGVAPKTRNPQTNVSQPLQPQTTNVQSTGSDQVLNRPQDIAIPAGSPAKSADESQRRGAGLFWLLVGLTGFVLLGALTTIFKLNGMDSLAEAEVSESSKTSVVPAKPAIPKKPQPKKKKSQANRSHTRKKRKK
jgi:flagellar basal body-associated protein FliL